MNFTKSSVVGMSTVFSCNEHGHVTGEWTCNEHGHVTGERKKFSKT